MDNTGLVTKSANIPATPWIKKSGKVYIEPARETAEDSE